MHLMDIGSVCSDDVASIQIYWGRVANDGGADGKGLDWRGFAFHSVRVALEFFFKFTCKYVHAEFLMHFWASFV